MRVSPPWASAWQRRLDPSLLHPGKVPDLAAQWRSSPPQEMAGIQYWSITLAGGATRRPRWLTESGRFSSNPALALRLVSQEVAARRVLTYMKLRGWPTETMERFVMVPSPPVDAMDGDQGAVA